MLLLSSSISICVRVTIASIVNPESWSDVASALPRCPAPMMATRFLPSMRGSIAEAATKAAARALYWRHGQICFAELQNEIRNQKLRPRPHRFFQSGLPWASFLDYHGPGARTRGVKVRRDLIHHSGSVVVLAVDDSRSTPRVLLDVNTGMPRAIIFGNYPRDASIRAKTT